MIFRLQRTDQVPKKIKKCFVYTNIKYTLFDPCEQKYQKHKGQ